MPYIYGYKRLLRPEDWEGLAGADNWVPCHSAYELAHAWQGANGIPSPVAEACRSSGVPELQGLRLELALVEKPVFLDTLIGPSMTDLMGYARNRNGDTVVLAVEGKAQEPFALPLNAWLRGDTLTFAPEAQVRPSRARRLEFLCQRLGLKPDQECPIGYQLFHRTVSAVSEAELHGAAAAVVLIHAFGKVVSPVAWSDFVGFLERLQLETASTEKVMGPARLGTDRQIDTYFLWHQADCHGQAA